MTGRAVVYLPDPNSRAAAGTQLAGRSLLLRTLMACERVGIRWIGIPRALRDAAIEAQLETERRLRIAVVWLDRLSAAEAQPWSLEPLLLLPANVLLDPMNLRRLLAVRDPGAGVVLDESKGSLWPVVVAPAALTSTLWERLAEGTPLGEDLENEARRGRMTLVAGGGCFFPILDEASRLEAEATLFQSLGIRADSQVDRLVNRRLSRWVTRLLVRLPVTPNQVSLLSLGFGLGAAWMLWFATPASALAGLLLYMVAVVLDHSDGEVARLTFQESAFGEWLDLTIDTLTHALVVLGMGVTASGVGGGVMVLAGASAAAGVVLSAVFARVLPEAPGTEERLGTLLKGLGTRDLFYMVFLAFILGLWLAPKALLLLVGLLALGSHGFWLTCVARHWFLRA